MSSIMRWSTALLAVLLLLAPANSHATQVEYLPLETLGAESPVVVRGEVVGVRSYWNSTRTRILTETSVQVTERYKGAASGLVQVVQMGGELDGIRMTVAGSLAWQPGEDVVLFLEDSLPGRYRVAGFSQGKFGVVRDPRTGVERVVQAPLGGVELIDADAAPTVRSRTLQSLLSQALPNLDGGE